MIKDEEREKSLYRSDQQETLGQSWIKSLMGEKMALIQSNVKQQMLRALVVASLKYT